VERPPDCHHSNPRCSRIPQGGCELGDRRTRRQDVIHDQYAATAHGAGLHNCKCAGQISSTLFRGQARLVRRVQGPRERSGVERKTGLVRDRFGEEFGLVVSPLIEALSMQWNRRQNINEPNVSDRLRHQWPQVRRAGRLLSILELAD
jgi:hypothetical protein